MEYEYLQVMKWLVREPVRDDRTGVGRKSRFGPQIRCNLQDGFPLLTTRKLWFAGVADELLWFLSGSTNANDLPERTRHWWDKWADEDGELGPIYGQQLRHWDKGLVDDKWGSRKHIWVDQVQSIINKLHTDPLSSRHVMTTWNAGDLDEMNLPPCHGVAIQFYAREMSLRERISVPGVTAHMMGGDFEDLSGDSEAQCHEDLDEVHAPKYALSCKMYQRSADWFIGVPHNIASYALFTHMVAQCTNMAVDDLILTFGDAHLYANHVEQAEEQLGREPKTLPDLHLNPDIDHIDDFEWKDIEINNYHPHPKISASVAV